MAFATRHSPQQFQTDYHDAVVLYSKTANVIRELKSLNISDKLIAFFNGYSDLQNRNPEIARKIEELVVSYQEIEVEAQKYVMKTKEFAQENNLVAQNVLAGNRYYHPESILQNFQKTAGKSEKAFTVVVNKHLEVERKIACISHKANVAGQQAGRLANDAEINTLCSLPVAGMLLAPVTRAVQWADKVDNPVAKGFVSLAGIVAGFLQGVISTVLLGIPAYAANEAAEKLKKLKNNYHTIVEVMKKFDQLVKTHKDLLIQISVRVNHLTSKYQEFEEDLKSGSMQPYQIDLFKNTCENIIEACNMYLDLKKRNPNLAISQQGEEVVDNNTDKRLVVRGMRY